MFRFPTIQLILTLCLVALLSACNTEPQMKPKGDRFFDMPWPNDLRLNDDGSLDFSRYQSSKFHPLVKQIADVGSSNTKGFGINSAVYFHFEGAISDDNFPEVTETLDDSSLAMLVNIEPTSDRYLERTPLRLDYKRTGSPYRPTNLLTLLPWGGFGLAFEAQHVAIIFNDLKTPSGKSVKQAELIKELDQPWQSGRGVNQEDFELLQAHWQKVKEYVTQNTGRSPEEVLAFTVFTTQNPVTDAFKVANSVHAISDQEVIDSVYINTMYNSCDCTEQMFCLGAAVVGGVVELPRWQQGESPYLLEGGNIITTETTAIQNGTESVEIMATISCAATDRGRPVTVIATGTGGSAHESMDVLYEFNQPELSNPFRPEEGDIIHEKYPEEDIKFKGVSIAVSPLYSSDRRPLQLDQISDKLEEWGIPLSETDISAFAYYNYLNPVAGNANQIQNAADLIYVKRVAYLLDEILSEGRIGQRIKEWAGLDGVALDITRDTTGILAQSQGGSTTPLALAMDSDFVFAHLNGAAGHSYPQPVHRGSVRNVLTPLLIGSGPKELDDFNPLVQFVQTFFEPADATNYAAYANTNKLLITAGYYDGCVVRESAGSLGLAYARANKITVANGLTGLPLTAGIDTVLGQTPFLLPAAVPYTETGSQGAFIEMNEGHFASTANDLIRDFLIAVQDNEPIYLPELNGEKGGADVGTCDERID